MSRSHSLPSPVRLASGWAPRLAYALLLAVLSIAAVLLAADADPSARATGLRLWVLAGAGLFAVAFPNVLFPDPNVSTLQLLNWPPTRLLRYQGRRMGLLLVLVAVPAVLATYADPRLLEGPTSDLIPRTLALGQAFVLLLGTALDSFVHFSTLGARSQAWHEGRAGHWYTSMVEETGHGVSLPPGLVPALYATTRCFTIAIIAVVLSAVGAEGGGGLLAWAPGLGLVGWAGVRILRHRTIFDRHFYQTTALYSEVLGGGPSAATSREPVPIDALYWVPSRWRPATWAQLLQLDRRLPLGRLVAVAHLGLWLFCLRGLSPSIVAGYLLAVVTGQVATCGLLATPTSAPRPFQITLESTTDWVITRSFVNLRWLGPHVGSLALVALFDSTYGASWVASWTAVHIVLSVGAAAVVTLTHEGRRRRMIA